MNNRTMPQNPDVNRETFRRLWPYLTNYKLATIIAIISLIITSASNAFAIYLLKPLIDEGFGSVESSFLSIMPFLLIGVFVVRGISYFISSYCLGWISGHVILNMRNTIFNQFTQLPVSFFDQHSSGHLISKITNDCNRVSAASSEVLINLFREGGTVFFYLCMLFWQSAELSLILVFIVPAIAFIVSMVTKRLKHLTRTNLLTIGELTTSTEQMLKGHREMRIYNGHEFEKKSFCIANNKMRQINMKIVTLAALTNPIINFISSLSVVTLIALANVDSIRENLTAGTFSLIFATMFGLLGPVRSLTKIIPNFQAGITAAQTLFELIDLPTEENSGDYRAQNVRGDICFENVSFAYPNKELLALNDISFTIPAGKTYALVGRSGSGKSTITSLMIRFYNYAEGRILLDGHEIKDYEIQNLRSHFAIVSQHVHLYNDTIANNIAYAATEKYTREQIAEAAQKAHLNEFTDQLPDGLDTVIGENGITLSGGQRQRIAIARALLRQTPILILDEATSALDNESEASIQRAMLELQNTKTIIIIAHRLTTIEHADQILVIDDGTVIEQGRHLELLERDGAYARIHHAHQRTT